MLVPAAHISFEHMVYLHDALSRGDELRLATCSGCGALLVAERVALIEPRCIHCAGLEAEYGSESGVTRETALGRTAEVSKWDYRRECPTTSFELGRGHLRLKR